MKADFTNCPLHLECEEEELSDCQKLAFENATKRYNTAVNILRNTKGVTVLTEVTDGKVQPTLPNVSVVSLPRDPLPIIKPRPLKSIAPHPVTTKNETINPVNKVQSTVITLTNNGTNNSVLEIKKKSPSLETPHQVYINKSGAPTLPQNVSSVLKSHPILITFPKPHNLASMQVSGSKRAELDAEVKSLLMMNPSGQVEWLLRLCLLRLRKSCRSCSGHVKLAKVTGLPEHEISGGYVWVCDSCPGRYESVFSDSIFECVNVSPSNAVKLIYHWACQTASPNVAQWVKTDYDTIAAFYSYLRTICVWKSTDDLRIGGNGIIVELGLVTLGKRDGDVKNRLIDLLGLYDRRSHKYIVKAFPVGNYGVKENLTTLLETIPLLVQPRTMFIIDNSINKIWLRNVWRSYKHTLIDAGPEERISNQNVMTYLKKIVPPLFQYNLQQLQISEIQSFLNELGWREAWGKTAADAFKNMLNHIGVFTGLCKENVPMAVKKKLDEIKNYSIGQQFKISLKRFHSDDANSDAKNGRSDTHGPPVKKVAINPVNTKMIALETYYYGHLEGRAMFDEAYPGVFKCNICWKTSNDNIQFMKHLYLHLENSGGFSADLYDLTQCKYCFRSFGTPFVMQTHVEEIHLRTKSRFYCKICNVVYQDRLRLQTHMESTHVELEMPFVCEVCEYRSSIHRDVLEHFQQVHTGTDKVLCHFCLKVMKANPPIQFFTHIQRHHRQRESARLKCRRCFLHFHLDSRLKSHLKKDHTSMKGIPGVINYVLEPNEEPTLIPKPIALRTNKKDKIRVNRPGLRDLFYKIKVLNLNVDLTAVSTCKECHLAITTAEHFSSVWSCALCPYFTCCIKAMTDHHSSMHLPSPSYSIGWPTILPGPMFCVCRFCTKSGNRMAAHLVSCDKRSCYPSIEAADKATFKAQSATFPPLVTIDDAEEGQAEDPNNAWIKAFHNSREKDTESPIQPRSHAPSVLNMLGLVRREPCEGTDVDKVDTLPTNDKIAAEEETDTKQTAFEPDTVTAATGENDVEVLDGNTSQLNSTEKAPATDVDDEENDQEYFGAFVETEMRDRTSESEGNKEDVNVEPECDEFQDTESRDVTETSRDSSGEITSLSIQNEESQGNSESNGTLFNAEHEDQNIDEVNPLDVTTSVTVTTDIETLETQSCQVEPKDITDNSDALTEIQKAPVNNENIVASDQCNHEDGSDLESEEAMNTSLSESMDEITSVGNNNHDGSSDSAQEKNNEENACVETVSSEVTEKCSLQPDTISMPSEVESKSTEALESCDVDTSVDNVNEQHLTTEDVSDKNNTVSEREEANEPKDKLSSPDTLTACDEPPPENTE